MHQSTLRAFCRRCRHLDVGSLLLDKDYAHLDTYLVGCTGRSSVSIRLLNEVIMEGIIGTTQENGYAPEL